MPELPEVETVRRGLERLALGRVFKSVKVYDSPRSFPNSAEEIRQFLIGAKITAARRRAKVLLIDLSSGYTLVTHLKMTGQVVFRHGADEFDGGHPTDSIISQLPDKLTRVSFELDKGDLFFNDQRKFGWMMLVPTAEVLNMKFMQTVGPEPLEDEFTPEVFIARIRRRKGTSVKAALLDQTVLAGVGNIYADEALWGAQIHPAKLVGSLTDEQLTSLHGEIRAVMALSIEKGGSTDRNYVDAEGRRGTYIEFARVFRREGKPCSRHPDVMIEKTRVAGRGTHTCPVCQSL